MSLGVYIQVPFCQTKCTYCNFHTGVVSRDRYEPYADAVCREIAGFAAPHASVLCHAERSPAGVTAGRSAEPAIKLPEIALPEGRGFNRAVPVRQTGISARADLPARVSDFQVVNTVYFGGGTPSLLDPEALVKILEALGQRFDFAPETLRHSEQSLAPNGSACSGESGLGLPEITIEADPETVTPEKAANWRAAGFNRISLGVQSFNDRELQAAGRMHRRDHIAAAAQFLRAAGFANISMDLIAGLPHQTRASWEDSLAQLVAIRPEHISIYILEIDEGSRLGKESLAGGARYSALAVPPDDDVAEFYESACERLSGAGYEHYEISNWALPGFRSRHNLKYWRREPYFGFGAGAHSFDGATRWANVHDSAQYVSSIERGISPCEQIEAVTPAQAFDEEFFLGLRQLEGIDLRRIERDYASSIGRNRVNSLRARIDGLQSLGLLHFEGSRLRLAPGRLTVSNEVFVELLG